MRTRLRRSAPFLSAPFLLAVAVAAMTFGAGTAAAHGDEGELTLTRLEVTGPTTVEIEVGIVYEGDGHLAENANVTASLTGPEGAAVGPLQLERTGETTSLYAVSTEVTPGDWAVQVTSTEPTGEVSGTVTVIGGPVGATEGNPAPESPANADDPTTTTTDDDDDDGGGGGGGGDEPVAFDGEAAVTTAAPVQDDGGSNTALIVGLGAAAVVLIGGAVVLARNRRPGEPVA